ncbi:MAG: response regulator transcription factor [Anaerolineae bacterium]
MCEQSHLMLPEAAQGSFLHYQYRLLVIEDERDMARLVSYTLRRAGYEVHCTATVDEALSLIERIGMPHMAIVDLMLPGMGGFEFCRRVQEFSDLPILIISAIHDKDTIIRGIRLYAEDYITKPFDPQELLARVERVLRRIGNFAYALQPVVRVDDHLAVNFARQQAYVRGTPVTMTPLETKLLYILMRNAGRVVTTDFLLRRLWPCQEVYEDTLRVHIHRLRQKIEPDPARANYIITQRGVGYLFPLADN